MCGDTLERGFCLSFFYLQKDKMFGYKDKMFGYKDKMFGYKDKMFGYISLAVQKIALLFGKYEYYF